MRCAYHPDVETNLGCGKCGKPICPRCLVQTPVGARCPDCARLYRLPTYRVSTRYYLSAIGAGLGVAAIYGVAWGAAEWVIPVFSLNLLLAPVAGYVIGEVASLSVNRKRGRGLAVTGGVATALSFAVSIYFHGLFSGVSFSRVLSLDPFSIVYNLVALALGVFIAVSRLR